MSHFVGRLASEQLTKKYMKEDKVEERWTYIQSPMAYPPVS